MKWAVILVSLGVMTMVFGLALRRFIGRRRYKSDRREWWVG